MNYFRRPATRAECKVLTIGQHSFPSTPNRLCENTSACNSATDDADIKEVALCFRNKCLSSHRIASRDLICDQDHGSFYTSQNFLGEGTRFGNIPGLVIAANTMMMGQCTTALYYY